MRPGAVIVAAGAVLALGAGCTGSDPAGHIVLTIVLRSR
jgi:hypothetical protein